MFTPVDRFKLAMALGFIAGAVVGALLDYPHSSWAEVLITAMLTSIVCGAVMLLRLAVETRRREADAADARNRTHNLSE